MSTIDMTAVHARLDDFLASIEADTSRVPLDAAHAEASNGRWTLGLMRNDLLSVVSDVGKLDHWVDVLDVILGEIETQTERAYESLGE